MLKTAGIVRTPSSIIWDNKSEKENDVDGWLYCGRYMLVVLNALFFVSEIFLLVLGALLASYGLWFLLVPANQNLMLVIASSAIHSRCNICMFVIIAVGVCTILFANVGCCGAVSNSKCVLGVFFLLLLVLFMGLVAVIGLTVWIRLEIAADIDDNMLKSLMESYKGDHAVNEESAAWNAIHRDFQCCGVSGNNGYLDFTKASVQYPEGSHWYMTELTKPIPAKWPASCCRTDASDNESCYDPQNQPPEVVYTEGCKEKVESFIYNSFLQASGIAAAVILIEIVHFVTVKKLEAALNDDV